MVRLAMKIFCRHLIINKPAALAMDGPLLLAVNHPNSFLDAVILDTIFERPIWSLARGDVFKSKGIIKVLTALRILPVYRVSEGAEYLSSNYETFANCQELFRKNEIVLIFSEGRCINEWHLRSLRKGTARLSIASWEQNIPLKVLPVGINYSSFRRFGKNIILNFGTVISKEDVPTNQGEGATLQSFNKILNDQLKELVLEIPKNDIAKQQTLLEKKPSQLRKILLAAPAAIGFLIHWPLYRPIQSYVFKKTNHNDHYDSVLLGVLLFTYPIYLLLITLIVLAITGSPWAWCLLLMLPVTAWCYVQVKPQLDKV